ncbi:uncharacterized protein LOC122870206 isoform X2 [Siniperca chuatsi]|uniref:uncharacterized protein LOC122870206 isoform X2 n=1 Tax=Siniperca chuatsi TaxID=119488 RepID=UPI001CE12D5D|nr:uncharacterized protein LOC122870206 isoform X2 [Siniperca chuatsi]
MMKSWSRLCFLVLAISSISRGQNDTPAPHNENINQKKDSPTPTPLSLDKSQNEASLSTTLPPHPQSHTPVNATVFMAQETVWVATTDSPDFNGDSDDTLTTEGVDGGSGPQTTASVSVPQTTEEGVNVDANAVSMTTAGASSNSGYVILVLIILVIIVLCVILYFLRRVSRTYSFDLQRPSPVNHHNEPTGTFEPVYLDDLDQPASKDQVTTDDLSPPPANGSTIQSEEKGSNGENAPQETPDANGLESSPTSNTSLSLGDDPADKTSSPSTFIFFDSGKEQQNENNNNPSVCSSDPFVEINLDDPAWCDQFLTSPEATSSVLPFSPFSFSSSSS